MENERKRWGEGQTTRQEFRVEDSEEKERRRRSGKVGKLRLGAALIRPPRGILGIRVLSRLAQEWVEGCLTTTPKRHREEAGLEGGRPLIERVGDIRVRTTWFRVAFRSRS